MSMRRLTRLTNGFSKKWENPLGRVLLALRVLQPLQDSQNVRRHPRDGNGHHVARMDVGGSAGVKRVLEANGSTH
jgi:hypothetical protein